ncbi:unnamed protein product [Rotaria socialis]|uniref:NACHT domain-containing protein n=2 Tax=Rotaria socialis TaxID=392032 RepID=A0A820R1A6_9BILA|nr:unnamed protein product [Rotaria socialis]
MILSMAKAVNDAAFVCCFMTQEYEDSVNCKLELQHAQKLHKPIIPCMVSNRKVWKPSPSKWLDLITGSILAVDFSNISEENINTKVRELIDRIKKQSSAPPAESNATFVKLLKSVRQKYLEQNRIKRIVNEEIFFPLEQSYINLAMVEAKEQQEKEKNLKQQRQNKQEQENEQNSTSKYNLDKILGTYEEIHGVKISIHVEDIFQKCNNEIKKVLVLGRAGIGKSTFCLYVTYLWAKSQLWSEYDLVILIHLRRLADTNYPLNKRYTPVDLAEMEYFQQDPLSEDARRLFKQQYDKRKFLWILDGYDEFSQSIPEQLKRVFDNIRETQHHILTSRPYAIDLSYDVKMEIIGFTNDNIPKYIEQFFGQIKDDASHSSSKKLKLLNFLRSNPSIWGVAHIPVNLELICSLWSNNDWIETDTLTITALYDEIIEWLCRRHLTRQHINHTAMTKLVVYKQCYNELRFLEHLAFKAMENNNIMLPPKLLMQTEAETECYLSEHPQLLNMGIFKSYDDSPIPNQNETKKQHYFVHLSFQEHFAARHLLRLLNSPDKHEAINYINNNKYQQRFRLVFVFAAGLIATSHYESCKNLFWTTIQGEPLDLVGIAHVKLIIECLNEGISQTVDTERAAFLKFISQWLNICITVKKLGVTDNLLESFQRADSLVNASLIQNKLIQLLQTQDIPARRIVIQFILKLEISNPIPKLISAILKALVDEDKYVRGSACEVFVRMSEKAATDEVVHGLLNALRDKDDNVTKQAINALVKMADQIPTKVAIDGLCNALYDEDSNVRCRACEVIGKMGGKAATNQVFNALLNALQAEQSSVRCNACEALGKMGGKAATNDII